MPLHFQASKDVLAGGAVVIAKGAAVTGEVLEPGKKNLILGSATESLPSRSTEVTAVDGSKLKVKASPGRSRREERAKHRASRTSRQGFAGARRQLPTWRIFDGDQTVAVKK